MSVSFHIYLQYNDGIALYARIRFTKMFYQVLTLMGRKQQLQQNLSDCQRLLSNCSDMLHIMILTVGRGEKANEVCKYIICREFIMNFSFITNCFHKFRANYL